MPKLQLDNDAVSWRVVNGDIVAVDLKRSEYLTVNAVGKILWLRLAEGADAPNLTELLCRETGVERAQAHADVAAFIDELGRRGVLRETD